MNYSCPQCRNAVYILHHNPRPPDGGPCCPVCESIMLPVAATSDDLTAYRDSLEAHLRGECVGAACTFCAESEADTADYELGGEAGGA